jgi:acyl carrier protein
MENSNLRNEISELINKITESDKAKGGKKKVDVRADFIEGINVDSLMALEIVAALEKKYKIEVKEDDLPKLGTVDDIVELVEKLTGFASTGKRLSGKQKSGKSPKGNKKPKKNKSNKKR